MHANIDPPIELSTEIPRDRGTGIARLRDEFVALLNSYLDQGGDLTMVQITVGGHHDPDLVTVALHGYAEPPSSPKPRHLKAV